MSKCWTVYDVSPETKIKCKLLATIHKKTLGQMLNILVENAFQNDRTPLHKKEQSIVRRMINRWHWQ